LTKNEAGRVLSENRLMPWRSLKAQNYKKINFSSRNNSC
jgi:hypothetical protein